MSAYPLAAGERDSIREIADAMLAMRREIDAVVERLTPLPRFPTQTPQTRALSVAKWVYRMRRQRERALAPVADHFHDPAWDILIDLFIAHEEHRKISVSSACIAAKVPGTTALRAVTLLEERGMVVRSPDPHDSRRKYVRLSMDAAQTLRALFESLPPPSFEVSPVNVLPLSRS